MVASVRIKRTSTPNSPPANLSLQPGELAVEMDLPTRLWVGVPPAQDATGKKLLVDTSAVSGAFTMADDPPATPVAGDLWWETDTGSLFVFFNDGTSSQWVETGRGGL